MGGLQYGISPVVNNRGPWIYGNDFAADDIAFQLADLMEKGREHPIARFQGEKPKDFDRENWTWVNLSTASQFVRNRINEGYRFYYREEGDEYNIKVRYAPEYRNPWMTSETSPYF